MIEFDWPWLLLSLPLPWLVRIILSPREQTLDAALQVPFLEDFEAPEETSRAFSGRRWPLWTAASAWLLLVLASARPLWFGEPVEQAVSGRDLMMAVDLSGSMQEKDFLVNGQRVDRLTATKWVGGQFIDRRIGDRLGLILFGDQAYLQTPLTFDRETVKTLLDEAAIGLAGEKTAIGDAIGLAVKRLRDDKASQNVVILLTDGANTAGAVSPEQASKLAASKGLKIYTIGIGADEMVIRDFFGSHRVNPSADLDEETLRDIAEKTGGSYFRARDTKQLEKIYRLLDELEPTEKDKQYFRPQTALFIWPLAGALVLSAALTLGKLRGLLN